MLWNHNDFFFFFYCCTVLKIYQPNKHGISEFWTADSYEASEFMSVWILSGVCVAQSSVFCEFVIFCQPLNIYLFVMLYLYMYIHFLHENIIRSGNLIIIIWFRSYTLNQCLFLTNCTSFLKFYKRCLLDTFIQLIFLYHTAEYISNF
jgi:hypothetical protein